MEKEKFKSHQILLAYCCKVLGKYKIREGTQTVFKCPFGRHERLKLKVGEKNGVGVWKCWACDMGGDIFTLAAKMNGLDVKKQFKKVINLVRETIIDQLDSNGSNSLPAVFNDTAGSYSVPEKHVFLSDNDNAALKECAERLKYSDQLKRMSNELQLSESTLMDAASGYGESTLGLLGVTEDGRLLYLYTGCRPDGETSYTGAKLRRWNSSLHSNFLLRLNDGRWQTFPSMNAAQGSSGTRFSWVVGKAYQPWGLSSVRSEQIMMICEGESDAMAVNQAFRDIRLCSPFDIHAVAIPGVSNFKQGWEIYFKEKSVILAMDSDPAGRKAFEKIKKILERVGCIVIDWVPSASFKDAREMLTGCGEEMFRKSVFESISNRVIEITKNRNAA